MSQNKYIVVKGGGAGPKIGIHEVVANCDLGLCVRTTEGEPLSNILKKLCNEIVKKSDGTFIKEGDNITISGKGTVDSPYVISSYSSLSSVGLEMPQGFTVDNTPLTSDGTLIVKTNLNGILKGTGTGFGVIVIGDGLDFNGTTLSTLPTSFIHDQINPTNIWYINHNLGARCSVSVFVGNKEVFADVEFVDNNNVKVTFSNNQVGYAICKI